MVGSRLGSGAGAAGSVPVIATTTRTGLTVQLDTGSYPTGIEVTKKQMKDLDAQVITPHQFHADWNYTIAPGYSGLDHDTPGIT